jgi:hypothetical protein
MTLNAAFDAVREAYDAVTYGDYAADLCLARADRELAKVWREWTARARLLPATTRRLYWMI